MTTPAAHRWRAFVIGAPLATYAVATVWATTATSFNVWGGMLVGPVLLAVSLPVLRRVAAREPHLTFGLLVTALVAKLLSSLARFGQSYGLYQGGADGERYHDRGVEIAAALHDGLPWSVTGPVPGTGVMEGVTGYLYWAMGPTRIGGFLVFSWLGFWGLLLIVRAFSAAVPDGHVRRYALMTLFLPSLLFWPSSIGKEAWMTLALGLAVYGGAGLLIHSRGATWWLVAGLGAAYAVRPHMAALAVIAIGFGYVVRPRNRDAVHGPLLKGLGVLALSAVVVLVVARAGDFLDTSRAGGSVGQVLETTSQRTDEGSSAFEATPVRSPLDLPWAGVTVVLRPFPWEAHNVQTLVAAAEGLLLMVLSWRFRRSLLALPRAVRRYPYVLVCLVYVVLFVTAFSGFSNFGVLTRQRVQVLPFVLVLLALPSVAQVRRAAYVPARLVMTSRAPIPERAT